MNKTVGMSVLRQVLTVVGVLLVGQGVTDAAHWNAAVNNIIAVIGAGSVLVSFIWGIVNAIKHHDLKGWFAILAPSEQMAIKQSQSTGIVSLLLVGLIGSMLVGCAATGDGIFEDTSTVFGAQVVTPDSTSPTVKLQMGMIRNKIVKVNTNCVAGVQMISATDAEGYGFWKGERVHTVFSVGGNAVSPPAAGQQRPYNNGTTTAVPWQPAIIAK